MVSRYFHFLHEDAKPFSRFGCKFLVLGTFLLMSSLVSFAESWEDVGGGTNNSSHGMVVWDNKLINLGSYTNPCNRVAAWDGSDWSCLGGGVGVVARAGCVWNENLVVVGDFWNNSQPCTGCNGIAMWDGTQWLPFDQGFNNDVLTCTIHNGELIVGGDFTKANGVPVNRVVRWDVASSTFQSIGSATSMDNDVRCMTSWNGRLWVGGDFNNVDGCTACDGLVVWDDAGQAWEGGNSGVDLVGGVNDQLRVLYVSPYDNNLYMGGHFPELHDGDAAAPDPNMSYIAMYDGYNWHPLGTGLNEYVRAIHAYNGNLIAGGFFTDAGGVAANKIAKWNGSSWSAMGQGFDGVGVDEYVKSAMSWNGIFFAGGAYTQAEGSPMDFIAQWSEPQSEVANTFPADLPGQEIGSSLPVDCPTPGANYEPSGAVWHPTRGTLFVVSDDGCISELDAAGSLVQSWALPGDLEAITLANPNGSSVYVGIEHPDSIVEFDIDAGLPTRTFDLTGTLDEHGTETRGLEALTFVDDPAHPEGGSFYAGLQNDGRIYVFDLPVNTSSVDENVEHVCTLPATPALTDISALQYHVTNQVLYAIYDPPGILRAMRADGEVIDEWDLPGHDQEGIGVNDCDLFIAADSPAMVWRYGGFPGEAGDVDGDGVVDCADDCPATPPGTPVAPDGCVCVPAAVCGNGRCEVLDGENCVICPLDCNGLQAGNSNDFFCCGDGGGTHPVPCTDQRCTEGGLACTTEAASCCGDATCGSFEDACGCPFDCGAALAAELSGSTCDDGADNDCDEVTDCEDPDCGAPAFEQACGDAQDDDCDGLVDCADPDCCAAAACAGPDSDGDGFALCDCDDGKGEAWTTPGEPEDLLLSHDVTTGTTISWSAPAQPGGLSSGYEVVRSSNVRDFVTAPLCLIGDDPTQVSIQDDENPCPGCLYAYLVRATNECPSGDGSLGRGSNNRPRPGPSCQ